MFARIKFNYQDDHSLCYSTKYNGSTLIHHLRIVGRDVPGYEYSRIAIGYYPNNDINNDFIHNLEFNAKTGNISSYGTIYYMDLVKHSSKMFKTNINQINDEIINEIFNINAKTYKKNNEDEIGFILEDLIDKCPNLIKYLASYIEIDELNDDYRSKIDNNYVIIKEKKKYVPIGIKYQNIIPILFQIIKNQQNKIDKLENQINNLIETNKEIINSLNILKDNMNMLLKNQEININKTNKLDINSLLIK